MRIRRDPLRSTTDREVDAVLSGRAPAERSDLDGVALFAAEVRGLGSGPAPVPVGRLAELLDAGLTAAGAAAATPSPAPRGRKKNVLTEGLAAVAAKLGGAAFVAKTGAGVAVALTAVTGAAAADVLPQPVQDSVAKVVESVTPANVPDSADAPGQAVSEERKHQGRDEHQKPKPSPTSIETPVATTSPDARRTGRPASPGQQGLDQANSGPAAGHAPTAVPRQGNGPGSKPTDRPAGKPTAKPTDRPDTDARPTSSPAARPTGKPVGAGSQGDSRPRPTQSPSS